MKRSVVVTGASTGIGLATAKLLAAEGFHVFAGVRKQADADRVSAEIGEEVTPLLLDIVDPEAIADAAKEVASRLGNTRLAGLVNNAGVATPGPLLHLPIADLRQQIEINVIAQIAVVQAFAPLLGSDLSRTGEPGRIVNISSVAGKLVSPFLGAYAASKHALEALSDALRRELIIYGIDVIVIEPGSVATPIWDKAEAADFTPYFKTDFRESVAKLRAIALKQGRAGHPPERIAASVLRALVSSSPPTRIPVVKGALANWIVPRLLPDRVLDRMVAKMMGLKRLG
jgi:hypothetical protein